MAFVEQNQNGLIYMSSTVLPARHAFLTRFGGGSTGPFASLNLGSNRGDDPEAVREEAKRLRDAGLDVPETTMTVDEMAVELCRIKQ